MLKRLIDIIISLTAIIILLPIFLWVAYKVRTNLGSPIFFLQERPGKNEQPFKMIKFRSMRDAVDEQGRPLPNEERITPFGHKLRASSLDELPQLINVLKGEMSIVGPRPQLTDFLEHYTPHQRRRHEVKPGITGLAQVSGRNHLSWEEKFDLDVEYVDTHNIFLDFKIIIKTFKVILIKEGIDEIGKVGSTPFTGVKADSNEQK